MTKKEIIKDLKERKKALKKQATEITDDSDADEIEFGLEVLAKLELVEELLEEYKK